MSCSPGTLIVGAHFVCRHVSMLRALLAHGFGEGEARCMIETAARAGQSEVRFTMPGTPERLAPRIVIVRRMRGNHAEVWEQLVDGGLR